MKKKKKNKSLLLLTVGNKRYAFYSTEILDPNLIVLWIDSKKHFIQLSIIFPTFLFFDLHFSNFRMKRKPCLGTIQICTYHRFQNICFSTIVNAELLHFLFCFRKGHLFIALGQMILQLTLEKMKKILVSPKGER